jgi:hypothetical protein
MQKKEKRKKEKEKAVLKKKSAPVLASSFRIDKNKVCL